MASKLIHEFKTIRDKPESTIHSRQISLEIKQPEYLKHVSMVLEEKFGSMLHFQKIGYEINGGYIYVIYSVRSNFDTRIFLCMLTSFIMSIATMELYELDHLKPKIMVAGGFITRIMENLLGPDKTGNPFYKEGATIFDIDVFHLTKTKEEVSFSEQHMDNLAEKGQFGFVFDREYIIKEGIEFQAYNVKIAEILRRPVQIQLINCQVETFDQILDSFDMIHVQPWYHISDQKFWISPEQLDAIVNKDIILTPSADRDNEKVKKRIAKYRERGYR